MVWSPTQRLRLAVEKEKLDKYFLHGVTWIDPTGETKVDVRMTSNADTSYTLRIYIPGDFPNSCPKLVVVSPTSLGLQDGSPIPELSDGFHTLKKVDGFQSICHFYPPDWTSDNTLYQVFMKGRLWIEAYEAHLRTGASMDEYLGHQMFTFDPDNPWVVESGTEVGSSVSVVEPLEAEPEVFDYDVEPLSLSNHYDYSDDDSKELTDQEPRAVVQDPSPSLLESNVVANSNGYSTATIDRRPAASTLPFSPHQPRNSASVTPVSSRFSTSRLQAPSQVAVQPPPSHPPPPSSSSSNSSSSLPRNCRPAGSVDVFAALRERSGSSPGVRQPPPVKPKPGLRSNR